MGERRAGRADRAALLRASAAGLPALLRRPGLWPTAVRSAMRLAPASWYRHPPFLPLPPRRYLAFRQETMYGRADHRPDPDDLVRWLQWCRDQSGQPAYR